MESRNKHLSIKALNDFNLSFEIQINKEVTKEQKASKFQNVEREEVYQKKKSSSFKYFPYANDSGTDSAKMTPCLKPRDHKKTPSPMNLFLKMQKVSKFITHKEELNSSFDSTTSKESCNEEVVLNYNSDEEKKIKKEEEADTLGDLDTFKSERKPKKLNTIKLIPDIRGSLPPLVSIGQLRYKIGPSHKQLKQSNIMDVMTAHSRTPRGENEKELYNYGEW
jgi:hypothetical protein